MKKIKITACLILIVLTLSGCGKLDINETTTSLVTTTYGTTAEEVKDTTLESVTYSTTIAEVTSSETTTTAPSTSEKASEVTTSQSQLTTSSVPKTTKVTTSKAVTTTKAQSTTTTTKKADVCYVSIVCTTINDNITSLKPAKKSFVPADGIILSDVPVDVNSGDTAFDVIKKACKENTCKAKCKYCQKSGIQIEYTYTPAFDNYYIEGIHQIYEKDCGTSSGWMYSVNGVFPNVGVSAYDIAPGDKIVFAYTCNLGEDVGNSY